MTLLRNDSLDDVYGGGSDGEGGVGPGADEDEDALLARPARTQDEWERQLDILYRTQLAEDRKNCDPTCDCEVCQWCRSL